MRAMLAIVCSLGAALLGGGCSGAESHDAAVALDSWFRSAGREVKDSSARMTLSISDINVKPPPSRGDLEEIGASGIAIGAEAKASAREFSDETGFDYDDVQGLYCELFVGYAESQPSVDLGPFLVDEMEWSLQLPEPPSQFEDALSRLKAIGQKAESSGEAALLTAAATVCSA